MTKTKGHKAPIKCSVKNFVNFACRSGDLESYSTAGPTAAEGQKAHKALQAKKSCKEKAEVKVECELDINDRQLNLSGRIDLLNAEEIVPIVSEIKSCYAPPAQLPASAVSLHWAQLKVYGYCVLTNLQAEQPDSDKISLRLIWYNLIADEVTIDEKLFNLSDLKTFIDVAADIYINWIDLVDRQFTETVASAARLEFPHQQFRSGQRDMAASVYVSARDGLHLMCEAPTGIGKTVSALFPAVKAIGNGDLDRIIYLTAKNSGKEAAGSCLQQLTTGKLNLSVVTITAKKTTCHCSNGTCQRNTDDGSCPLTIGFFDRLPKARLQLIQSGIITPDTIDSAAHKHALCPFELSLQMLPWVQVVICDFNYVFDPLVRLGELTENTNRQLILVDEAHNLVDRARSMYSATLDRKEIKYAIADLDKNTLAAKNLQSLVRAIDRWSKQCSETENSHDKPPDTITRAIKKCMQAMQHDADNRMLMTESIAEAGKAIFRYAVILELFGDHHRCITQKTTNTKYKNTITTLQCLNATEFLRKSFKQYRASVTFSATLRPQHFYVESLGLPDTTTALSLASPFSPSQQSTLLCDWVDTRYKAREQSITPIVEIVSRVYRARRGNYQVFFPSYAFMTSVHDAFTARYPEIPVIQQNRGSTEQERQEYLQHFAKDNATLAFSILGGIFGEGVDYTGEKLIGSIIVGTGLSSLSLTQKLIEEDYKVRGLNGFDYASRYPGFTRVLQTAGRVIRTETDKGVVVLIDQRFGEAFYHALYPSQWRTRICKDPGILENQLNNFWQSA